MTGQATRSDGANIGATAGCTVSSVTAAPRR